MAKTVHHPAMPYNEIPNFVSQLKNRRSISSKVLQLLILTATRTSEVLNATWDEFNMNTQTWVIPAERMKSHREHRIPISTSAMSILESLPKIHNNNYLFPGMKKGKPLSNMALLQMMRKMGYGRNFENGDYVPHGSRSSFRDWTGEETNFPRDVAEMALAHSIENKVEAAYRRKDLFDKRRVMMSA